MLHQRPFHPLIQILFSLSEYTLRPFLWTISKLLSVYVPVSKENKKYSTLMVWRLFVTPPCLAGIVVLSLPAGVAFLSRCLLHSIRQPYALSKSKTALNAHMSSQLVGDIFTVVSGNLCLLPECLVRFNNLNNSHLRSKIIGERIVIDQLHYKTSLNTHNRQAVKQSSRETTLGTNSIIAHFPQTDFLCLQETWDRDYSKVLMSELHKIYPWILYDVGVTSYKSNRFILNSGLMLASRYPILDADFKFFEHSCKQCLFSGKGLLMAKVQLSTSRSKNVDNIAYIFTTHLQAYEGNDHVLDKQLDAILAWADEFRKETHKPTDNIVFDVLSGDFNFDNLSPGDKYLSDHRLFTVYEDVCSIKPGKDHTWTIGTEHRPSYLWEQQISTPEGLRDALLDPSLRQRYLVDADLEIATEEVINKSKPKVDKDGNPVISPVGGKRRIDYILYRKENPVNVKNFNFITKLATLTDHIPVSMTFSIR